MPLTPFQMWLGLGSSLAVFLAFLALAGWCAYMFWRSRR